MNRSRKNPGRVAALVLAAASTIFAADQPPADWVAAGEKRRAEIPLGGDFKPDPKAPVFVAVGHGARILLSRNDGKTAENVFVSADAGNSWDGPHPTGTSRSNLNAVNGEFWLTVSPSRASADGKSWRDLPEAVPAGQVIASPEGTLVSINARRFNILRSSDGGKSWEEVYRFEPETEHVHGAQGPRDIAFGYVREPGKSGALDSGPRK